MKLNLQVSIAFLILPSLYTTCISFAHKQSFGVQSPDLQYVPLYAELDVSETQYLLTDLLNRIHACGKRLVWFERKEFIAKGNETELIVGPVILVATGGPSHEEQEYFRRTPPGQQIVLLHPSDEFLSQTTPSLYGDGVVQVFRHYHHAGMGDQSLQYLLQTTTAPVPRVLWMPLGLANLRSLPPAFKFEFLERPYLWAWAGDTGGKPERTEMLGALANKTSSNQVMKQGTLRTLAGYGGRPGGAAAAASAWEYSMAMHSAQFAPAPAGICAEQFRIWEALEAGCIPILLERHMAPGSVLYPIRFLRFEVVQLGSWQEVPEKLLQLGDQMAHNPQIWTRRQQHNSKLWAHVKGGVATRIAQSVCEIGRPSTTQ